MSRRGTQQLAIRVGPLARVWLRTLQIALAFWSACLALTAVEASVGSTTAVSLLFFASIPALVGCLTWANKDIVAGARRALVSVVMLGVSVLLSSTLIILVGLAAAAKLKELLA